MEITGETITVLNLISFTLTCFAILSFINKNVSEAELAQLKAKKIKDEK